MTLRANAEREVREFHEFIECWLAGRIEAYDRAEAVLPEGFEIISPSGERRDGAAIRADLRDGRGTLATADPPFEIRIRDPEVRDERTATCLLTYEEWQRVDGDWEGRVSTALFGRNDDAPNGVEWRHLHETWLPDDADGPDEGPASADGDPSA